MTVRRRVVVHGHVQGVFFRDSCRRQALTHGVAGWVANRPDGTVEAAFEGDDEAVAAMLSWVRVGPDQAEVLTVDVVDEDPQDERGFTIRH